jgi:hypothetical protein
MSQGLAATWMQRIKGEHPMKKGLLITLLVLLAFPAMVMAQERYGFNPGDWEITLNGSGTSDEDFDDTQFAIEGSFAKFLTRGWQVGVRQGVGFVDRGDDDWNGSTRLFTDYNFDLNRLQPFLGLNFGYLYGDGVNNSWIVGPEGGLKYFLLPDSFLFASMEYNITFDDASDISEAYDDGRIVYGLGLGIRF